MDLATKDLVRRGRKFGLLFLALVAFCSVVFFAVLLRSGISFFAISGDSMEPTLSNGDSVILKQEKEVRNGQIVFFRKPARWDGYSGGDKTLVKRIVASPGDSLSYDGESFKVNGEVVFSLSKDSETNQTGADYKCENGDSSYSHVLTGSEIFVMGDNPSVSLDSRRIFCDGGEDVMFVPKSSVRDYGKILHIF